MYENLVEMILLKIDKEAREKNISLGKLGQLVELSENTIYNWYNKGCKPTLYALNAVCEVLGIPLYELFIDDIESIQTIEEKEFLSIYRKLSTEQKKLIKRLVCELVNSKRE